jgi:hypothetical protein
MDKIYVFYIVSSLIFFLLININGYGIYDTSLVL